MISLKRYLDQGSPRKPEPVGNSFLCSRLVSAFRAALAEMAGCGIDACPDLGPELAQHLERVSEALECVSDADEIESSERAIRTVLRNWGKQVGMHYDQKTTDVRDLLLVLSRTAESFGQKDDRFVRQLDTLSAQLASIASLDDVTRMRASIEASAYELKRSMEKMTSESRALIDHLRVEVSACQARLEKAEHIACCDALTGLGSRHWVEARIEERIASGAAFSIAVIDIDGFGQVVKNYGNLVGDLLLKEFARELRSACRFTDIVGRWGSDEFIMLLESRGTNMELELARVRAWVSRPYHVPGRTGYVNVPLRASIGVASYEAGEDIQTLLERADLELCRRKDAREQKTA